MPLLSWDTFAKLPGSAERNFENLCRNLIRRQYGQFGDFAALAAQPGVEFHLKLHTTCSLGTPGRWYGWQCRWYDLPSGRALGFARRKKIEKAIRTTERELPGLTDWVLWTRHPLTKGDQKWFTHITTHMRKHQWTSADVEGHLTGEATIFRGTYFGELVLTPALLADLRKISVAPIRPRWQPEAHQTVDAERTLRQVLAETSTWDHLKTAADDLKTDAEAVNTDSEDLLNPIAEAARDLVCLAEELSNALSETHAALNRGDLDILQQQLMSRPGMPGLHIRTLPRKLRSLRHRAALTTANAVADVRGALAVLDELASSLEKRIVSVLADAGCGKTQLAAQLTVASEDRPAGILLHGRDLSVNGTFKDLLHNVVIAGVPVASMDALLAAVDAAGQRAHRRLPIIIDGLNEAEDPRDWMALLASLNTILSRYPYVLIVCTVRTVFADEALPEELPRLTMPNFGHDTIPAIMKYFAYYRIDAADAELPFELLTHPLTLRLFCEATNPTRKSIVGVEAMPGSLTGLFDKYLDQVAERIAQLAPRSRKYYVPDIQAALDEVGSALWEEKARSLDVNVLRGRLGDADRPWNESIVRALEQESVLLRYPGDRVTGVYDALAGHLIGNALLRKLGRVAEFESWLKEPGNLAALNGSLSDQHPLAADTFNALVGLFPRRLYRQQLWPLLDPPLRSVALRAAANLEGTYLDLTTVNELSAVALQKTSESRDLFHRLFEVRGAASHPLNADFLDGLLRSMTLTDRDLRWTEWIRANQRKLLSDLQHLETHWRKKPKYWSRAEQLRGRWLVWMLTSTVHEIRDRATRVLYWFGRRDPEELFRLTLDSLALNDPYVSERMLAAAYGVCMALHCRPKRPIFRQKLLGFAKAVYQSVFALDALHSTTHVLAREYARRIIDVARIYSPSLISKADQTRVAPPYKDGGIRTWASIQDPNDGKYREGNSPLGMDFENYTIGRLVPSRHTYDYKHEEFKLVVGQIVWRLYQLGYSLEVFGEIDKDIAGLRYRGGRNTPSTDRYGKKCARIAYFEQYGLRQDAGLLKNTWSEHDERPLEADIDPSFPDEPYNFQLIGDFLGDRSGDVRRWVQRGPTPGFMQHLVQPKLDQASGPWLLLDGHCYQRDKDAERLGFVMFQSFLLLQEDVDEFLRLMRKETPGGRRIPEPSEDHLMFAGEIPWCDTFSLDRLDTVDFIVGTTKKKVSPKDPRYNFRIIRNFGETKETIGPRKPPQFEQVNLYRKIPIYVPIRESRFSERPSCTIPGKYVSSHFGLWLDLPTWNMRDRSGRLCSVSTARRDAADYEHHLFLRKELIDDLLASQKLALVWVVWGERQHFAERQALSGTDAHGYKYFRQIYRYAHGQPKRVE
jgi:hypothetical protein